MPNPNPSPLRYRDAAGSWHPMLVRQRADGAWEIIDVAEEPRVIETLTGFEEGREEAEAIARDYIAQHHHPDACARHRRARVASRS